ncbi:MAG: T9SS type A sorting domain-containing protein [candidate division Zixibacteria bacterium]|nr:T9SS type A sorting domain-containing protein [candidate division Zixibacteria bacterium]
MKILYCYLISLFLGFFSVSSATIINIPGDYPEIQSGIDVSSNGDTVLVQPGTYYENLDYGGRNITLGSLYLTSGDTSYISSTILDGSGLGRVVIFRNGEDTTAVLAGFTITNGSYNYGSGIYCANNSNPIIEHNLITANVSDAGWGGGIFCSASDPVIRYNTIKNNTANQQGGGIYCGSSSPEIYGNTIVDNNAENGGGGIYCVDTSNPLIDDNYFNGNNIGTIYCFRGSSPYISSNFIVGDSTDVGYNIFCYIDANPEIRDNIIETTYTGAIHLRSNCNASVINNTISKRINLGSRANILCQNGSNPTIKNTILWGNFFEEIKSENSYPVVSYCAIAGGWEGEGNIDSNPIFIDSTFNICNQSPCIDAGDPSMTDPDGTRADIGAFFDFHPECELGNRWYVGVHGNDTTGNGTEGAPFRTIQHAVDISLHRDTIIVLNGTYNGPVNISGKAITLASNYIFSNDYRDITSTILDGDSVSALFHLCGTDGIGAIKGFTVTRSIGNGIRCSNCSIDIHNNIIDRNYAYGIFCFNNSVADIRFNHITGNYGDIGAALYSLESNLTLTFNTMENNEARRGGAIYIENGTSVIEDNIFKNNIADQLGGAICVRYENSIIRGNLIFGNSATEQGGGVYSYSSQCEFMNNTIGYNTSASSGGGMYFQDDTSTVKNTIIWGNEAPENNGIFTNNDFPVVSYSNVQGGWPGQTNISTEPFFRDPDNGDYHLMAIYCGDSVDSPCIDKGDPGIIDAILNCSWGLGNERSDMGAFGGGDSIPTYTPELEENLPGVVLLNQNYPNPFNSQTLIEYYVPIEGKVELDIYNLLGRKVVTLVDQIQKAGKHQILWEASGFSSGIYFYKLNFDEGNITRRMTLVK